MGTPDEFSADESNYYTPSLLGEDYSSNVCDDSFFSRTGSCDPLSFYSDGNWVDALSSFQYGFGDLREDMEFLITDPTATPTMPLPSLSPNKEPYAPEYTTAKQLGSTDQCMIIPEKGKSAAAGGGGEMVEQDLSEQQQTVVDCDDALSRGGVVCTSSQSLPAIISVEEKQNKRKLASSEKQKTTHPTILQEDLERQFGKTRAEAAKSLGVSVPTLKRVSRRYDIARWPCNKKKNKDQEMSVKFDEVAFGQTSLATSSSMIVQPEKGNQSSAAGAAYLVVAPISMLPEAETEQIPEFDNQLGFDTMVSPPKTAKQDERPMTVKVKYLDDYVRFEISPGSKMVHLEEEISKRLKLKVGSFDIKYLDEDKDWVLVTCDEDLWYCMKSIGRTTIKMLVMPLSN